MTHCRQEVFQFQGLKGRKVTTDFTGGYLSSGGGGLFLREVELRHRIITKLSHCFADTRNQSLVVRQRLKCTTDQRNKVYHLQGQPRVKPRDVKLPESGSTRSDKTSIEYGPIPALDRSGIGRPPAHG